MVNNSSDDDQTDQGLCIRLKNRFKKCPRPDRQNLKILLLNIFNVINWLPKYDFRSFFVKDLMGGITLGVVLVPQTMGYSLNGVSTKYNEIIF
jgi:hypothetical protein